MGFTKRDPADTPFTGTNLSVSSGRLSRKYMLQTKKGAIWRFVLQTVSQNFLLTKLSKEHKNHGCSI